ncbi:MAG: ATP-binding protein [bacterium]|jgi:signal transduction histidine kinase|nr:ATP-binding protein [bacterium]
MTKKITIPILLLTVWCFILVWQAVELRRFEQRSRVAFLNRARDISNSLAVVLRSQRDRRSGGFQEERLETALRDLVDSKELISIVLLNANGEVITSAGAMSELDLSRLPQKAENWGKQTVSFMNLVDLGEQRENEEEFPAIIYPEHTPGPGEGDRPPGPPPMPFGRSVPMGPSVEDVSRVETLYAYFQANPDWRGQLTLQPPAPLNLVLPASATVEEVSRFVATLQQGPQEPDREPSQDVAPESSREPGRERREPFPRSPYAFFNRVLSASPTIDEVSRYVFFLRGWENWRDRRRPGFGLRRPPWIGEQEYQSLLQKRGLHAFVIEMSTEAYNSARFREFWMRGIILSFAALAMIAFGVAWRNLIKSAALEVRLVRASEMNAHLREMNLAAAGLAHETRNPLNLVRGLAQVIAKQDTLPPDIRQQSLKITEEVDRVTAQLNEFIEYSKPREAKPTPVSLNSVIADVERALSADLEDKMIQLHLHGAETVIHADEGLLRQVLFNLVLNAIQSVPEEGEIHLRIEMDPKKIVALTVEDNGPGIAEEHREKIFRPYYTTREQGTGLGLSVVQQIVQAHGWDIECLTVAQGAAFQIRGIRSI